MDCGQKGQRHVENTLAKSDRVRVHKNVLIDGRQSIETLRGRQPESRLPPPGVFNVLLKILFRLGFYKAAFVKIFPSLHKGQFGEGQFRFRVIGRRNVNRMDYERQRRVVS